MTMDPASQQQGTPVPVAGEASPASSLQIPPCLPYRDVTADTIEDAYVQFIVYCNPGLPGKADIATLRESFRSPPRSGGKAFDAFVIFQLVRQFYQKEIKTWAELTTKLGVEPPDPSKEESTQKIAQYGVRLKKWMNSMHVKAFFEYLMNIPNDYWTQIPTDQDPTAIPMRDGVAIEDDMALRALLPHIRRKKGRKRPGEEDHLLTPSLQHQQQRPRLSPSSAMDDPRHAHGGQPIWSAAPDVPRSAVPAWGEGEGDAAHTPVFRWPQSAVTPSTRAGFWEDPNEPQSAVTPSGKKPTQRRGVKNVSSAWKTSGPESSGKTRGRPPINRTPIDGPSFTNMTWPSTPQHPLPKTSPYPHMPPSAPHASGSQPFTGPATTAPSATSVVGAPYPLYSPTTGPASRPPRTQSDTSRPPRPSISLQVPERPPGSVRLATPPGLHPGPSPPPPPPPPPPAGPSAAFNGDEPDWHGDVNSTAEPRSQSATWSTWTNEALDAYSGDPTQTPRSATHADARTNASATGPAGTAGLNGTPAGASAGADPAGSTANQQPFSSSSNSNSNNGNNNARFNAERNHPLPDFYFEKMEDRTNVDTIMSYFIQATYDAEWCHADGSPAPPATLEEATAIVNTALQTMYRSATSPQVFLINLAALAGARHLMNRRARYVRRGGDEQFRYYSFEWDYRFGHVQGKFTMLHKVPRSMWPVEMPPVEGPGEEGEQESGDKEKLSAADWQKKYENLLRETERRNREMWELRTRVMGWGRGA